MEENHEFCGVVFKRAICVTLLFIQIIVIASINTFFFFIVGTSKKQENILSA